MPVEGRTNLNWKTHLKTSQSLFVSLDVDPHVAMTSSQAVAFPLPRWSTTVQFGMYTVGQNLHASPRDESELHRVLDQQLAEF